MNKVLIIGPFPDPVSGVSLANEVVVKVLKDSHDFEALSINTSYPIFEDRVGSFSLHKLFFFLKLNFKAFKIFKADIIYVTPGQTFFGIVKYSTFILLSSFLKKELIIHVHGNFLGKQYNQLKGLKKKIFYFLISKFSKGIVLSESLKSNLTPFINVKNIYILKNFAEDYLYENSKKNINKDLKIVYLSNLMKEKGIFLLLDELSELEKRNINYEAKIAGNIDESLKVLLLEKINNLKNTSYCGVVYGNEKKELLEWSNIFILPTFYEMEGQPISIIEALATQNVVISTNHAGIPDIITNRINGYIVEPKSSGSILKHLLFLSSNKSKIKDIAITNQKYFINNFTTRIFTKEFIRILNENPRA